MYIKQRKGERERESCRPDLIEKEGSKIGREHESD